MLEELQTRVLRTIMRRYSPPLPIHPTPVGPGIFKHESFRLASPAAQRQVLLESAQYRYDHEMQLGYFKEYFPWLTPEELRGKTLLDLGCFTGGRLVRWKEAYGLGEIHGIDIDGIFGKAALAFAETRGVSVSAVAGVGEHLPYQDNSFDFIVASDVFEHVQSVEAVMHECYRTLKPGGRLLTSFPQLYQPLESHLGMATRLHGLQWLFSPSAIRRAYTDVQGEHPDSYWYRRPLNTWGTWEVLPSLNGITVRKFRRIVRQNRWTVRGQNRRPILSSGRRAKRPIFRLIRAAFVLPARMPILEELFVDRICVDLEKAH